MKYSSHPTPEDWKKAEDSMSNEQKLASDLRQMEIRPSQEQLKQIVLDGIDEEFGGTMPKHEPEMKRVRVPTEEEIANTKKTLDSYNNILESNYVDSLELGDFAITWMGTHEFEGREHANFFVAIDYKGEEFEFVFNVGSKVSRAASKFLPENASVNFNEDVEKEAENELLLALREGIKEDLIYSIKEYSEEIDESKRV